MDEEKRVPVEVKITVPDGASKEDEIELAQAIIQLAQLLDPGSTARIIQKE